MVAEIENSSEVVIDTSKEVLINKDASTKVENNLELTVSKKEYRIVGDEVVVPTTLQDAPQWLIDLSSVIANSQIINNNQDLLNSVNTVLSNFATAYTSLSTFTNKVATIDSDTALISANLSTLSTSLTNSITNIESSISSLNLTKLDSNAVEALSAQVITAQVNNINTTLGSTISTIQQSIVDAESSISSNYTELSSTLTTLEGIAQASATLVDLLQTYVGMDNAGASTQTGLSAYLVGSDGQVGSADSKVTNNVYVDTLGNAKTKWDYNSVILVDGVYRKSGFGLTTNYSSGLGTEADPYLSEFWIDASRLKFTNSAQTGQVAPFTIDATGATPKITFNGIVDFTSTNTNGTTTLDGDNLTTGTVDATKINVSQLSAISANIGTITAGYLQNTGNTNYIDLNATGTNPFLKVNNSVQINADGSGSFAGNIKIGGVLTNGSLYKTGYMQDRGAVSGTGLVSFTDFTRSLNTFFLPNSNYIILDVQAQLWSYNMGDTNTVNSRLFYNNVQIAQYVAAVGGSTAEVKTGWVSVEINGNGSSGNQEKGLFLTNATTALVQKLSANGNKTTAGNGYLGSRWRIIVLRQDVDNFPDTGWGLDIWEA